MTKFTSRIQLGKQYKDGRTGIEGHANIVSFQEHGCVEIVLEYMKDGKPETLTVNELRLLTLNDAPLNREKHKYETDLEFGHEYEDVQTKIRGHLAVVDFHEHMATRGIIRLAAADVKGRPDIKYLSIDEFLLKDTATEQVPEDKTGKRSPATHEVFRR